MYYTGEYINERGKRIKVEILTGHDNSVRKEIYGGSASGLAFPRSENVNVEVRVNAVTDPLMPGSATVSIDSTAFLSDIYSRDPLDTVVNIREEGKLIFAGFLEPMAYNQPFVESMDQIDLNCIDVVAALDRKLYGGIKEAGVDYNDRKAAAKVRSFADILMEIIERFAAGINISGNETPGIDITSDYSLPSGYAIDGIGVSEALFYGEEEDDTWNCGDVVAAILKYLNLHLRQEGMDFYLFKWEDLAANPEIELTQDKTYGADGDISIGECYNEIRLTCETSGREVIVPSPLDGELSTSPYSASQLYCREYMSALDDGEDKQRAFAGALCFQQWGDDPGSVVDWEVRVMENKSWTFNNYLNLDISNGKWQNRLPDRFVPKVGCALLRLTRTGQTYDPTDNSIAPSRDTTDYIVLGVNGQGKDYATADQWAAVLKQRAPFAEYDGGEVVLSPADERTKRYIVISGSLLLNYFGVQKHENADIDWRVLESRVLPKETPKDMYDYMRKAIATPDGTVYNIFFHLYQETPGGKQRYYIPQYFKSESPTDTPVTNDEVVKGDYLNAQGNWSHLGPNGLGLIMPDDENFKKYQFKYSAVREWKDKLSTVGVISCQLIVGNKCLVQRGFTGNVDEFAWVDYKTREQCATDDEFLLQSFCIGFDPKIGDFIIGESHEIRNNITSDIKIEETGTAIPVTMADSLKGKLIFRILGPCNIIWDEYIRRHKTWFRPEKWTTNSITVLNEVNAVFLKDFSIKIFTDNGGLEPIEENDLVYISDTDEKFVNISDGNNFSICSALSATDREALGVVDSAGATSTAIDMATGLGVVEVTHDGDTFKPEQAWVDCYWQMLHAPKVVYSQGVWSEYAGFGKTYKLAALPGKKFIPVGIKRDLESGSATIQVREI